MTPKEKANELVEKYHTAIKDKFLTWNISYGIGQPKQCALIAVDELLNCGHGWNKETSTFVKYWKEVKTEIESL